MQGVFITGTGTEVGKTFVGVAIARALTQHKIKVIPRKPVESGCLKRNGELIPQDASALKIAPPPPAPSKSKYFSFSTFSTPLRS